MISAGMISAGSWLAFAAVAFAMVITPGPNMIYMVSRSISQGRRAGMISLLGVLTGFAVYAMLAAFGITAILSAVPFAYDTLRFAGAAYLAWLAWNALRPSGASPFRQGDSVLPSLPRTRREGESVHVDMQAQDPPGKLFGMGLLTNLLNPKIAVLYLSLFPQFVDPARGNMLAQSMILGATQIAISATVNTLIIVMAGSISTFLAARPLWSRLQRWIMGTVLGLLAIRMVVDARK